MRKSLYLLVLAVVLVAGCASGDKTQMKNSELLRISGVTVTPGTVVAPDEIITIRMKLDNIGQEDVKFVWKNPCYNKENSCTTSCTTTTKAENGKTLFSDEYCSTKDYIQSTLKATPPSDAQGLMNSVGGLILYDKCSIYNYDDKTPVKFDIITSGFDVENSQLVLKPSRSALLEWTLKAPSETTIANMQHECTFRFQINYQAKAETYTYIYFANPDEKNQRTYTNKDMNLRGENVANFGPVYINFETAQDQPIKGKKSDTDTSTWTLYATVRNAGDGIGKVSSGTFKIDLPDLTSPNTVKPSDDSKSCDDFKDKSAASNKFKDPLEYKGDDSRLMLYSKQSSRFSCTLPAPKVDVLEPYRFISSADYIYTIDKELKILTVPKR